MISFIFKELITGGAVLSSFELVQALRKLGHDAYIVSDYNNKELEDYFDIKVEREPKGITIAVSPKCEGEYSYVRTANPAWLKHKSKKIAVSKYISEWLQSSGESVILTLGNGTHTRFYDMGLERDIDCLIVGNDESNKNIQGTIERARVQCSESGINPLIVWFGRSVCRIPGVESVGSPGLEEIPRLYNRAKCFISMSKEEGWGRPVAEAMACGCEVINENGGNREVEVVSWDSIAKILIKTIC